MIKTKAKIKGIRTAQTEIKANKGRIKALEAKIKGNEININMLLSRSVEPKAEKTTEGVTAVANTPNGA